MKPLFSGQQLFSNQISRTIFLEPDFSKYVLFYTFLEKWLQIKWFTVYWLVFKMGSESERHCLSWTSKAESKTVTYTTVAILFTTFLLIIWFRTQLSSGLLLKKSPKLYCRVLLLSVSALKWTGFSFHFNEPLKIEYNIH